jgi:hypothetical protein
MKTLHIFVGPIASGKTFFSKRLSELIRGEYIDLDFMIHRRKSELFLHQYVTEEAFFAFLQKFIELLRIKFRNTDNLVIDGWFSFEGFWWLTSREDIKNSLNYVKQNFPELNIRVYKLICSEDRIMKKIEEDPKKFRYPGYEKQILRVYHFLQENLKGFYTEEIKWEESETFFQRFK